MNESGSCGIPAGMDFFSTGTPREWSTNSAVTNFGVHTVFSGDFRHSVE